MMQYIGLSNYFQFIRPCDEINLEVQLRASEGF